MNLHLVDEEEVELLTLRALAFEKFKARYSHNSESQRTMVRAINRVALGASDQKFDASRFPWEWIIDDDLAEMVARAAAKNFSRATLQKDASAMRVMLDCCRKVGLISTDQYSVAKDFRVTAGIPSDPKGTFLSESDVAALIYAARISGGAEVQIRDATLLLVLASTGVRRDELSHVRLKDVHLNDRRIHLRVTKSGSPREAWLHPSAVDALRRWLDVRGPEGDALFVPLSRVGRPLTDRRLSSHQIWKVVRGRAAQAGLGDVAPHDLRRFVITTLLDHGVDVALVAKTVGHKSPTTTVGYDKRPADRQRNAIAQICLPIFK